MAELEARGEGYEVKHVHTVYEEIASHFSSTRYKVCVTTSYAEAFHPATKLIF